MIELQEISELAAKYVNATDRHIFLTGKAGTGKTTFLKYIVEHTYKNAVVAAPTGIAAINAGGVTLHSLLQLPFGTFIPERIQLPTSESRITTPQTLFQESRFNASKRKLIQELELLIIDEVSMLRADLLDCIDHSLRYLRKRNFEPFGGLQILFIGDLMQLPPVVREDEMNLLRPYYASPYFFEARALKENPPILVELQKIFRQSDQHFIDLLNRLRHNEQTEEDLQLLNEHYRPDLDNTSLEGYIHLTTHNRKADSINKSRLQNLEEKTFTFYAHLEGDFPDTMFPTGERLELKKGAQVMFIKNDPSGQGQFFNGKIGQVSHLSKEEIWVRFGDGNEILAETYKWENKRYVLNKTNNEINEKYMGSFEQYPLKLAWAVTVHKSQGLTFEKAILDLSSTFAPGQFYVALSRLTSLDGLVFSSPLPINPPGIDKSLQAFGNTFKKTGELRKNLGEDRREYLHKFTKRAFGFEPLIRELSYHQKSFDKDENRSLKQQSLPWTRELIKNTLLLKETGNRFIKQVEKILSQLDYLPLLSERIKKAQVYFEKELTTMTDEVSAHRRKMKGESKVKAYLKELEQLEGLYLNQNQQILKIALLVSHENDNSTLTKKELRGSRIYQSAAKSAKKTSKKDKTPTAQFSYDLYKQGKNIEEIATERGFLVSTIEGHLSTFVESGELDVLELMKEERLEQILEKYHKGLTRSGEIKGDLGYDFSYSEIKLALAHARRQAQSNARLTNP